MKSITVFCGSSPGIDSRYRNEAFGLGKLLAESNIRLVYGGARVGLMGAVADGALSAGGQVVGVLPHFLRTKEIAHEGLKELVLVNSMHKRKMKMHEMSDGAIALPGGFGTLEELFELLTWGQLGLHGKPIGILNTGGFYNALDQQLRHMMETGFLKETNYSMLITESSAGDLLRRMRNYNPPATGKWISPQTT